MSETPKQHIIMHATIEARRHEYITTFKTITEEEREYHKTFASIWNKVAEFVGGLKP